MITFFYGDDIWRKKQKLTQFIERFIREVDPSKMNVQVIEANEASEETLRSKILAAPFLAKKRMVVLKNLLTEGRRQGLFEIVLEALENLPEHSAVVISEDQAKPKKWKNQSVKILWEFLEKNATAEEFKLLWGAPLEKEIHKQAKAYGITLKNDAAALLAIMCAGDLGQVEQELQKLSAYCAPSSGLRPPSPPGRGQGEGVVTAENIKSICITQGEANFFAFLDALGTKNKKILLQTLDEQLEGNETTQLIAQISAHIRALLAVSLKGERGGQALHLHPFQLKKVLAQVRHWSAPELKQMLTRLMLLDFAVKSGTVADAPTQLTSLLAQIPV